MKNAPLILLFLIISQIGHSQHAIFGTVSDEQNAPIPYVSILLLHPADSAAAAHGITDADGKFSMTTEKSGAFILQTRCLGFITQHKNILLDDSQRDINVDFVMESASFDLQAVDIEAKVIEIQFKEDTIRYHVEAFMDGTERVLEDILEKLPGVEVGTQGEVKAHGKQVEKILLNGQDFYAGNTQMATKNIPSDIVENVDVLHNYSEYSLFEGFQSHEQTVLNVGVKKEKLGKITGNATAAGGYRDKYLFKGSLLQVRPKAMFSLLGAVNNTGEEVFSFEEYLRMQGGLKTMMNAPGGGGFTLSGDELDLLAPENNIYWRTSGLAAFNMAYQPNNKLKINTYLLFSETRTKAEDVSKLTYIVPDAEAAPASLSEVKTENKKDIFSAMFRLDYQASENTLFSYQGNSGFSGFERDNAAATQFEHQNIRSFGRRASKTPSTKHYLIWMQSVGKHLFTADALIDYRNNDYTFDLQTDSLLLPLPLASAGEWFFARQEKTSQQIEGKTNAAFLYRFNQKYFLKTGLHAGFHRQKYDTRIFQNSPDASPQLLESADFQNSYAMRMDDYCADAVLTKNKGLLQFKAGVAAHLYNFQHNLTHSVSDKPAFRLVPAADLSLHFSDAHALSLSYSENISANSAEQFASGIVFTSYQSYLHQSALEALYSIRQEVMLSYRLSDLFSKTTFSLTGAYSWDKNASTFDFRQQNLLTEYRPITAGANKSARVNLLLEKGFRTPPWTVSLSSFYHYSDYKNLSESIENNVVVNRISGKIELRSRYKSWFNLECRAGIEYVANKSSLLTDRQEQWIQNYAAVLKFKICGRLRAEASFEYAINDIPDYRKDFYFLNGSLSYELIKKKLDLELSGVNVLNLKEQTWLSIAYRDAYIAENYFRRIAGNVMLRVRYRWG